MPISNIPRHPLHTVLPTVTSRRRRQEGSMPIQAHLHTTIQAPLFRAEHTHYIANRVVTQEDIRVIGSRQVFKREKLPAVDVVQARGEMTCSIRSSVSTWMEQMRIRYSLALHRFAPFHFSYCGK